MTAADVKKTRRAVGRLTDRQKLDALFFLLIAWLPLRLPIRWRFFRARHFGDCRSDEKGHLIRIRRADFSLMRDCLLHEYAHALTAEEIPNDTDDHSDAWGMNYARVYRVIGAHWDGDF